MNANNLHYIRVPYISSYIDSDVDCESRSSGEAKPHLIGWWGLRLSSPPATDNTGQSDRTGADCGGGLPRAWLIWRQANDEYDPDSDEASNFYGSGLFPSLREDGSYTGHCIQLVDEPSTDGFLRGRLIPEMVDTEMIRGWLKRCAEKHGKDCKPTYLQIGPHPEASAKFTVIDVDKECLVNMPPGESYVALSYVWGKTSQLTTVKSLVSEFQKPGAFKANLPRTTRDAIDITRDLGFHYLWVDSLCIVQDDDETKGPLISNMDAVYGHAALTIIAASGSNVEAGLQGWRSSLPERQLFIESIGPDFRLGVLPYFDKAIMQSPHAQRGWT
jgi:hypothetical protein